MIQGMWPSKKAKYDAEKQAKQLEKAKETNRTPEEVIKELEQCSSEIGQKHHQIKCLEYEREQFTVRMNNLLLELNESKKAHAVSEPTNVVP